MVLKKTCADLEGWERAKSLIGEALSGNWVKKRKREYITNGGSGDLQTYRDPTISGSQGVTYSYNSTHGLTRITDPFGRPSVRNTYDAAGRLIQQVDSKGQTVTYNHDLDNHKEIVTNRLSQAVTHVYDSRGNILTETKLVNGLSATWAYTYDQYDNRTSELLPGNSVASSFIYADSNNPRLMTRKVDAEGNVSIMQYDSQGRETLKTSAFGRPEAQTTTKTYDTVTGNLLSVQAPIGTTNYTYFPNGGMRTMTDAEGCVTHCFRDVSGAVTMEIQANGQPVQVTIAYTNDANGNVLTETRQSSAGTLTTINGYDAMGRLTQITQPDTRTTLIGYDSLGKQIFIRNQKGRETGFTYDALGRPTTFTFADGTYEANDYDAEGRRNYFKNRRGIVNRYGFDENGKETGAVLAFGTTDEATTSKQYDAQGRLVLETDEDGNKVKHEYDQVGRRTKTIWGYLSANPKEITFGYDGNGNQTSATDAKGTTTIDYDKMNRPVTVTRPDGSKDITVYDQMGRKKVVITGQMGADPGKRVEMDYDCLGRITEAREFPGMGTLTTQYGWDQAGNMVSMTDARMNLTLMECDKMGRRIKRTLPNSKYEQWAYDETGAVTLYRDLDGANTTYTVNPATDRVTAESRPDGAVGYTYLDTGPRASKTDNYGTINYNYDARDRLVSESMPDGTLTYVRDGVGHARSTSSSNGNQVAVDFDAVNRPMTVTDSFLSNTLYHYDGAGNLDSLSYPDQVKTTFGYSNANRMYAVTVVNQGTVATLADYSYLLNGAGLKTQVTESVTNRQVNWTYDGAFRLMNEAISSDPNGLNGAVTYAWDAASNRTSKTSTLPPAAGVTNQVFAGLYDVADRLTAHSFDDNGSTLEADGRTYTCNSRHQITRVMGTGLDVAYLYDSDGNLVRKTNNLSGVVTRYVVDKSNATGYAQTFEEIENGAEKVRYTYGDRLISRSEFLGSQWVTRYYLWDGEGNIWGLADEIGGVTDTYTYSAWGELLNHMGTNTNEMLYKGERVDRDTGLIFLRARWMNPAYGRFLTRDMADGMTNEPLSLNRYLYSNADPVNLLDPSGNQTMTLMETSLVNAIMGALFITMVKAIPVVEKFRFQPDQDVKFRLRHYTRWEHLPFILIGGIQSPNRPENFYTPSLFWSGTVARGALALGESSKPQVFLTLNLWRFRDTLEGPSPVLGSTIPTTQEYWTLQMVHPLWPLTRATSILPMLP